MPISPSALLWLAMLLPVTAAAAPPAPPVVVELFTSQGCSSCPPADALLGELSRTQPGLLALDFHVDYWDRLGWRDPFSLAAATQRQRGYAQRLGSEVYTPQLVVDGRLQMVGSDRAAVAQALDSARQARRPPVQMRLSRDAEGLAAEVAAGSGEGELWLVGFDDAHTTPVGRGENAGRTLAEVNVVRSLQRVGTWSGAAVQLALPAPAGQRAVLLLQDAAGMRAVALLP
jgi:hypothetical protein